MANDSKQQHRLFSVTGVMVATLVAIVGVVFAFQHGLHYGTVSTAWSALWGYAIAAVGAVAAGLIADRNNAEEKKRLETKRQKLLDIVFRYNAVTRLLEDSYKDDVKSNKLTSYGCFTSQNVTKRELRRQYEKKYYKNKAAYTQERRQFLEEWAKTEKPSKRSRMWQWLIGGGLLAQVVACGYSFGASTEEQPEPQRVVVADEATTEWTAQSVPMPHLTDGRRYVSNPDGIISDATVSRLDARLKEMDDSLGIESAVIVVNHVAGQDIFQFAQDIFDIYKVGKDDRGLVMVLAYGDHLFRTHTGRSLEADLTDVESFRLQENYLVPSMKAEMPDSGMIYMVEATYNLLKGKEMPVMQLTANDTDESFPLLMLYMLMGLGWLGLYAFVAKRHGWHSDNYGSHYFYPNPFYVQPQSTGIYVGGGSSRGGFGGGGFGGGGSFGGGFSGGSSGGGGATSSW